MPEEVNDKVPTTLGVLGAKLDIVIGMLDRYREEQDKDHDMLLRLSTKMDFPRPYCDLHEPMRKEISDFRKEIGDFKLEITRLVFGGGVAGGLSSSMVAAIIFGVGKLAKWW